MGRKNSPRSRVLGSTIISISALIFRIARSVLWVGAAFFVGLFVFPGFLRSDSVGEVQISRGYAGSLERGDVKVVVDDKSASIDDLGLNLKDISGWRMSVYNRVSGYSGVAGRGDIYEVRFDLDKFNEFIESLDDIEVDALDAEIAKSDGRLELLAGVPGWSYEGEDVLIQVLNGMGNERMDIEIEPKMVNPEVGANDLIDNVELLYTVTDDIYVLHDGLTVVVTRSELLKFLRLDCELAGNICGVDLPCVNVVPVREYVNSRLSQIWKDSDIMDVVSNSRGTFKYEIAGYGPDMEDAVVGIVSVLSQRIEDYVRGGCDVLGAESAVTESTAEDSGGTVPGGDSIVLVGQSEVPGTDGFYADRYIEIDDSQQHLYVWENGEVIMDFEISGAFDKYVVFGVFEIREKSVNAWSDIAGKWMPYWMSFYYAPDQEAWYGIHELVWWNDANGIRQMEPSSRIGTRRSAGCLRMDRGKAEQVYNWARVGELVLIHP